MPSYLYINPDPATQTRAAALGCGWFPATPPDLVAAVAGRVPCAVVADVGVTTVLPEPTTAAAVAAAAQPILNAQAAAATAQGVLDTNRATLLSKANAALASNATFQAIGAPTTAQTLAQVQLLTKESNALIRLAIQLFDSTSGT